MFNPPIRSLNKQLIMMLPGFNNVDRQTTKTNLKRMLNTKLDELGINRKGITVNDYITAFNEHNKRTDNELFNRISKQKQNLKLQEQRKKEQLDMIRDTALEERHMMDINPLYNSTKSRERERYEEEVLDKKRFQQNVKQMMVSVKKHRNIEVDIRDDDEKLFAFTKVIRELHSRARQDTIKPVSSSIL